MTAAAAAASTPVTAQPPVAANTTAASRERMYLDIFTRSIGQFVPLVPKEALTSALRERQRLPQAMAAAVGAERAACEQAQVRACFSLLGQMVWLATAVLSCCYGCFVVIVVVVLLLCCC